MVDQQFQTHMNKSVCCQTTRNQTLEPAPPPCFKNIKCCIVLIDDMFYVVFRLDFEMRLIDIDVLTHCRRPSKSRQDLARVR